MEHSPFCERDYKLPQDLETHDEKGELAVMIDTFKPLMVTEAALYYQSWLES